MNLPVSAPREESAQILRQLPLLAKEARRHAVSLAVGFAVVALVGLVLGLAWPRKYVASTTIFVNEENIIKPLMEGRAATTSVVDRARIASEVVFSRRILSAVLQEGGWLNDKVTPLEEERMAEQVRARTTVASAGPNLIEISYNDKDPERTFKVARKFAELFIQESLDAKERESREAYEFIAARVDEYHRKLTDAEDRLKAFRAENQEARPGTEADVNARVAQLRGRIEQARTELAELAMRERALASQISGEAEVTDAQTRESQYRTRLAELQADLDRLLLSYTDEYPDVIRVRHQIEDLRAELSEEMARRARRREAGTTANEAEAEAVAANPVYQALRGDLNKVRSDMAALQARVSENEALLGDELERGRRVADSEATLAELTRDYEVNRDIYQDLLKRRENARVSMNLDAEHRGLTLRIQEPAALPLQPSGLRFLHFAAGGLGLGFLLPLGVLFALIRFDPRVRAAATLVGELTVPLLGVIPEYLTRAEQRRGLARLALAASICLAVLLTYAVVGWMRYTRMA